MADYGRGTRSKIYYIYPTMMKLGIVTAYQEKIKRIYKSRDISLESPWHQHFFTEISNLCVISKNTDMDFILKLNLSLEGLF